MPAFPTDSLNEPGFPEAVRAGKVYFYPARKDWSFHLRLTDCDLWYVVGGRGTLLINQDLSADIAPGKVFIFLPGDLVIGHQEPGQPVEVYAVHFSVNRLAATQRKMLRRINGHEVRSMAVWSNRFTELFGIENRASGTLPERQKIHLLNFLLISLWQEVCDSPWSRAGVRLDQVLDEIRRWPDRSWTVQRLIKTVGVPERTFYRIFRNALELSPQEFILQARVERAALLLEQTEMTVSEIADDLGYEDAAFFSRQFKLFQGISPQGYRKNRRK